MKNFKQIWTASGLAILLVFSACGDLDQKLNSAIDGEQATGEFEADELLNGVYTSLRGPYQDQARLWAMQEHTTDEVIGPTRGPDWDDNGIWRVYHDHSWNADHAFIRDTFNDLLTAIFNATNVLRFEPDAQTEAEARFLRAFVVYSVLDAWGQVPVREPGEDLTLPPLVLKEAEALQYVIDEVNAIINDLPGPGDAGVANRDAARMLLAKAYLHRGIFTGTTVNPYDGNRANPTFAASDMQEVIDLIDAFEGGYALTPYFDNFRPNNDAISSELIFTNANQGGASSGNVRSRWFCTLHYNQNPSGWNGFTTIGDFYDSFDPADPRRGQDDPAQEAVGGIKVGMLLGQQVDQNGVELDDRKGNKLDFTKEVQLVETGDNLEVTGIRVIKYPIDYNSGDNADNDYVLYRFADAWLMQAEAYFRLADPATALTMINDLRTFRGAPTLAGPLTEADILAERGFELYWEGHRRSDMIRFGAFQGTWNEKPNPSPNDFLIFPIPNESLGLNPNLEQNPGY